MATTRVRRFIGELRRDPALEREARLQWSFVGLARLSRRTVAPCTAAELREAFRARAGPSGEPWDDETAAKVASIDLDAPAARLIEREGYSVERANRVERAYRNFLYLAVTGGITGGGPALVPTAAIDAMWHQHLNDARAYQLDFAMRGMDAPVHHLEHALAEDGPCETGVRYERVFGEPYAATAGEALLAMFPPRVSAG